jgi:hypothetical protein
MFPKEQIRRDLLENPPAESQAANSESHKCNKILRQAIFVTHSFYESYGGGSICSQNRSHCLLKSVEIRRK